MCWPDHHYDYDDVNDDYDDYYDANDDYEDKEDGYQNIFDTIETTIVQKRAAITTPSDNLESKKLFGLSKYKLF